LRYIKLSQYIMTFFLFLLKGTLTLYYGKEAFHFEPEELTDTEAATTEQKLHFVHISEELDNDYWRLVGQGARDAVKFHNVYNDYFGPKQANNDEHLKTIDMTIAGLVNGVILGKKYEEEHNTFRALVTENIGVSPNNNLVTNTHSSDTTEELRKYKQLLEEIKT